MDFTKIYLPQPMTLGEFRSKQPVNKKGVAIRRAYGRYRMNFQARLEERIKNGERFYSAAEIAETFFKVPGSGDELDDCDTSYFRAEKITDIPRDQLRAFIVDIAIDQLFRQVMQT